MKLCLLLLLLLLLWASHASGWSWPWSWFGSSGSDKDTDAPRLNCRNIQGKAVKWYILYKSPGGQDYIYISNWVKSKYHNIGSPTSVLGLTLSPMFSNNTPKSFRYLSYNDQPPPKGNSVDDKYGHSKGVVLWDNETVVWLTHSAPRFPFDRNISRFWPPNANKNGQSFMCVTFKYDQLQDLKNHLKYIHPFVLLDKSSPVDSFFKNISENLNNNDFKVPHSGPSVNVLHVGNWTFKAVAKATGETAADGDLYVQLSGMFKSDVDAKTWGCQSGKDKSYCEPHRSKVMNVIDVETDLGKWSWGSDHSKWAVTTNNNIYWTCIADMNRAPSQYLRPGGALCIQNKRVTNMFRAFVKDSLKCGKEPSRKRTRECEENPKALSDDEEEDLKKRAEL